MIGCSSDPVLAQRHLHRTRDLNRGWRTPKNLDPPRDEVGKQRVHPRTLQIEFVLVGTGCTAPLLIVEIGERVVGSRLIGVEVKGVDEVPNSLVVHFRIETNGPAVLLHGQLEPTGHGLDQAEIIEGDELTRVKLDGPNRGLLAPL